MIRRILVFLAIIFVLFFLYRRYNKTSADNLLTKIRNLGSGSYTTTVDNKPIASDTDNVQITDNSLNNLISTINETISSKTQTQETSGSNILSGDIVRSIITSDNLTQNVQVPGLSGTVIINDKPIETLPSLPPTRPKTTTSTDQINTSTPTSTQQPALTPAEIEELNRISSLFN